MFPRVGKNYNHSFIPTRVEDWRQTSEQTVYDGYRKIVRRHYILPENHEADFDIIAGIDFACILALTPDNKVILARQFRPGPGKVLDELPGGAIDPGETPEAAARRELLEETGYTGEIQLVTTSWQGAYNTQRRYNFVATQCKKVADPKRDPNEPIDPILMSLQEFMQHLKTGELTDSTTGYTGLDFLGLL